MNADHEKRLWNVVITLVKYPISREDAMWLIERLRESEKALADCTCPKDGDCPDGYCRDDYTCPACEARAELEELIREANNDI